MYFQEEIDEGLRCPICKSRYQDPRLLPCGYSMCQRCIDELRLQQLQASSIKCSLCSSEHELPKDGFVPIRFIHKLLAIRPRNVYQGETIERFKSVLKSIRAKLDDLNSSQQSPMHSIREHCSTVRNDIDIAAETLHVRVNDMRDKLLADLKSFENECEQECKVFKSSGEAACELEQFIRDVEKFEASSFELLKREDLREEVVLEAIEAGEKILARIEKKFSNAFNVISKRMPTFVANDTKIESSQLGMLLYDNAYSSYTRVDFNQILEPLPDNITIFEFGKNNFVACVYNIKSHRLNTLLTNTATGQTKNALSHITNFYRTCVNQNYFFILYEVSYIQKTAINMFGLDFKLLKECNLGNYNDVISIASNNENLFILTKYRRIQIYNFDLKQIGTIEFSSNPLNHRYMPELNTNTIFKSTDEYVFCHNGSEFIAICLQQKRAVWRSTKITPNFTVKENVVYSLDCNKKLIEYYNPKSGCRIGRYEKNCDIDATISMYGSDWANLRLVDTRYAEASLFDTKNFYFYTRVDTSNGPDKKEERPNN